MVITGFSQTPSDGGAIKKSVGAAAKASFDAAQAQPEATAKAAPAVQVKTQEEGSASPVVSFFKDLFSSEDETPAEQVEKMLATSSVPDDLAERLLKGGALSQAELERLYEKCSIGRSDGSRTSRHNDAQLMDVFWQLSQDKQPKVTLADVIACFTRLQQQQDLEQRVKKLLSNSSVPEDLKARLLSREPLSPKEAEIIYQKTSIGRNSGSKEQRHNDAILMDIFWNASQTKASSIDSGALLQQIYQRTL